MSELEKAASSRHDARCPFCHADVQGESSEARDSRVACAACGTPHHAECFVENRGCSVMGCGSAIARTGDRADGVPVGVLAATIERRDDGQAASFRSTLGHGATIAVLLCGSAIARGVSMREVSVVLALAALGWAVVWLAGSRRDPRPAIRVEPLVPDLAVPEKPSSLYRDAVIFGPGDPYEPMRRRIAAQQEGAPDDEPVAPLPGAARPDRCPTCGGSLELETESPPFCYHCGISLA